MSFFRRLAIATILSATSGTTAVAGTLILDQTTLQRDAGRVSGLLGSPTGNANHLLVVEQEFNTFGKGGVRIYDRSTGTFAAQPFLSVDLGAGVMPFNNGVQSVAFAPDYATSGLVYVSYVDNASTHHVVEFTVDNPLTDLSVNPSSAREILTLPQPDGSTGSGHYGAWLGFSPADGHLYVTTGDRETVLADGLTQDPANSLLGAVLRIDPTGDAYPDDPTRNYSIPVDNPFVGEDGLDEIYAYGFRNPFTATVDASGTLLVADVGEANFEEINVLVAGGNYGWPVREGLQATGQTVDLSTIGTLTDPLYAYGHGDGPFDGVAVIAGPAYEDGPLDALEGQFIFADFTRKVFAFDLDASGAPDVSLLELLYTDGSFDQLLSIVAFGRTSDGTLFIGDNWGRIYEVVDAIMDTVPLPPAAILFISGAFGLVYCRRRA
ncbi:PQQ-dependent sugar dehydrogenase [Parvularcula sp. LCG005]|uniref:PQQ-dependent sugar dehydrogenase n=1 Tax=Parvularcula sp. LCG005 TaxID=3078805 RepID=UPI0029423C04|nr:PQQ-dependent sugar dehydrogenase [Parvularcula sp. LCG005]WOI52841.1 PQQ-dependent sugar dehydrogenase [Parvularcula sp. LCG005]